MHATPLVLAPVASRSFTDGSIVLMGERIVYALLGLVLIGATVPIGPTIPIGDRGAVAAACLGSAASGWPLTACALEDQLALAPLLPTAEVAALAP